MGPVSAALVRRSGARVAAALQLGSFKEQVCTARASCRSAACSASGAYRGGKGAESGGPRAGGLRG
jgi:hypothetical protein